MKRHSYRTECIMFDENSKPRAAMRRYMRKRAGNPNPRVTLCKGIRLIMDRQRSRAYKLRQPIQVKSPDQIAHEKKRKSISAKLRYERDKERIQEQSREYYHNNKEAKRAYDKVARQKFKGRFSAKGAKRRADKRQRTPAWYDASKCRLIYRKRSELSELYGVEFHVDHVVPLCGETVSGLHTWENLQLLEADLNVAKSNGFYPNGFPYINLLGASL